jgi:hypothetical protein
MKCRIIIPELVAQLAGGGNRHINIRRAVITERRVMKQQQEKIK